MTDERRNWVEHPQTVASLMAQTGGEEVRIGGRFVCHEEADEEPMWTHFAAKGFSLRGCGQCELVAMRIVRASNAAVGEVIAEMRRISLESGYRLQSVEAGDVDSGKAHVLAAEVGYVPWWELEAGN